MELGVVEMPEWGEPGFTSLPTRLDVFDVTLFSALMLDWEPGLSDELLLVAFCWAKRSCFRNFALRFWNHT